MSQSVRTVHLRVTDASGGAAAVRVAVADDAGRAYPPLGRSLEFPAGRAEGVGGSLLLGRERWFYVPGECEVVLPTGVPLRVRAVRGVSGEAVDEAVTLGPGQISLRLALPAPGGGLRLGACDARCHFITPDAAALEAAAEGLDVVQLLALDYRMASFDGTTYATTPNLDAYSAQDVARARHGSQVAVGTFHRHGVLGQLALLFTHRVVYPLSFGPPDAIDDWSLAAWCGQARRKRGVAVWANPFDQPHGGEALALAILGRLDALEWSPGLRRVPFLPLWYRLLDAGAAVPVVGASGKDSNRTPLGSARTYWPLAPGESATVAGFADAVRAGRTAVSTGPRLWLTADGIEPGGELAATGRVAVRVQVSSPTPVGAVELVHNSQVVGTLAGSTGGGGLELDTEIEVELAEAGWLALRLKLDDGFAHTSPIRVVSGGVSPRRATAREALARSLAASREWVERVAQVPSEAARSALLATWDEADA